jgi:hypothetical protein
MRDVFGQRLTGNPASGLQTTGFAPLVEYEYGRLTVERNGFRTLAVKYVNVDTLVVETAAVPITLESKVLQYNRWDRDDSTMARVMARAVKRKVPVTGERGIRSGSLASSCSPRARGAPARQRYRSCG